MDDGTLYSIGELARRTGLTVKTIRLYSDRGLVPPADRTPAGYRRYGPDAVARLALVRTLRELGLGLDTIRRVLDRDLPLGRVAAEHAAALDAQIGILRLRRAVLVAAAGREATFEEMERMHQLATLSEAERRRLIDDFLGTVFGGPADRTGPAAAAQRSLTPELPERPTEEQVTAWVELAELSLDPDFRARMRGLVEEHASARPDGAAVPPRPHAVAVTRDVVAAAVSSGVDPGSPQARPVVARLTAACAVAVGRPDDTELRAWLVRHLATANDPRRDRYARLLALINGWPAPDPLTPVLDWAVEALSTTGTAR
ncbi:MerR family transcriptional regulator [Streptomyces diastatochromogenes]|uniref:MerR family transcriptional regulator n=1 Tax=Streptomyces diastatochromogenes TaxID=42236 RepID=A0A233SET5_STRDA|nr:MerR family transcriptional regulator [Streptomyces diastatochromogenes]OXY94162.1 MerR family transcriptional regulator [Streptomyces diastatochromogenes]